MLKKQWDKLPIGTVLIYYHKRSFVIDVIEVKDTKATTRELWDCDNSNEQIWFKYYYEPEPSLRKHIEVAPKWIQELFKIKGG